jgi:hypothetical protein
VKPRLVTDLSEEKVTCTKPVGDMYDDKEGSPDNSANKTLFSARQVALKQDQTLTKSKPASVTNSEKVMVTVAAPVGAIIHSQYAKSG